MIHQEEDSSEEKYKLLYENSPDMHVSVNVKDATIRECNQTLAQKTGYSKEEIIGRSVFDLYHQDSLPMVEAAFKTFKKTGRIVDLEMSIKTKQGKKIPVLLNTEAIRDSEGNILYSNSSWKDITDIKDLRCQLEMITNHLEERVRERTHELELRNKELEQFVYIASHDLQEPIRTIMNFISLIEEEAKGRLTESEEMYVNIISQSSKRMKQLVKGLLDYSRIGREVQLVKVSCDELVKEVLADLSVVLQDSEGEVIIGELPELNAYKTEFRLLLQNLISNALKFRKPDQKPLIKISAENISGYWQFSFSDNGIGIAEEHKEKVFKIFQRLYNKSQFEGTGIGLAQCQKIVEMHNGEIWVESELNAGSTFYFKIPVNL